MNNNVIVSVKQTREESKNMRDSNIEIFRIVTMWLIIAHHYVVNSGLIDVGGPIYSSPMSSSSLFLLLFGAWGKIGINCFVLITGYFMCKSHITVKKFIKILLAVMFYRLVINTIFWITGYAPFTLKNFIMVLFPVTSVTQNFTGTYLIFLLYIPFLNILIRNINEKEHFRLMLLCCFTYVFFGTIKLFPVDMNYVSWYMVLYIIASYIRLYPKKIYDNKIFWGWTTVLLMLLSAFSVVGCAWLGGNIEKNIAYFFVTDSNTILAVLTGVSSFIFFKQIKMKNSKFINKISATTFGILLIHANSDTMRQWLWRDVLNNVEMYHSVLMPIHAIGSVTVIFIIGSVIDYLRIILIETPFLKWWDRNWNEILLKYNGLKIKFCKHLLGRE